MQQGKQPGSSPSAAGHERPVSGGIQWIPQLPVMQEQRITVLEGPGHPRGWTNCLTPPRAMQTAGRRINSPTKTKSLKLTGVLSFRFSLRCSRGRASEVPLVVCSERRAPRLSLRLVLVMCCSKHTPRILRNLPAWAPSSQGLQKNELKTSKEHLQAAGLQPAVTPEARMLLVSAV